MTDTRTYIKLHDGMPDHPKIESLSDGAFRLLISSWCWCSRHLTDGKILLGSWKKRGTPRQRKELENAGLVEAVDGAVIVHDYLEHQRSSEEVAALQEHRRRAGKLGGQAKARGLASAKQKVDGVLSKEVPYTETDKDKNLKDTQPSVVGARTRAVRGTRIPADFVATPDMIDWARANTPLVGSAETDSFIDYWTGESGARASKVSWRAAWQRWMRKAQVDAEARQLRSSGRSALIEYDGMHLLPRSVEDLERVKRFEGFPEPDEYGVTLQTPHLWPTKQVGL